LKKKFGILIAIVMAVSLLLVPMTAMAGTNVGTEVLVAPSGYDKYINLDNKDISGDTWSLTPDDGIGAIIAYDETGDSFDWAVVARGLDVGDYSLIYYADSADRFNSWGGISGGAGVVISAPISVTGDGIVSTSGSKVLGYSLPHEDDYNGDPGTYNYTTSDGYAHANGAKIWLVPTSALSVGVLPLEAWPPTNNWLFETDLVSYTMDIVAITVTPSSVDFGIVIPGTVVNGNEPIVVTNSGNIPVTVDADCTGGIFATHLDLIETGVARWDANSFNKGLTCPGSVSLIAELDVPEYHTGGVEAGTITFFVTP